LEEVLVASKLSALVSQKILLLRLPTYVLLQSAYDSYSVELGYQVLSCTDDDDDDDDDDDVQG